MFNLCSRNLPSSRIMFAVTGVARAMSILGITTFHAGQTLLGDSVLKIDPSGGSSA